MPPRVYPGARMKMDGKSGGSFIGVPWRVVLHTTETSGMPGYGGGYAAPHLTYDPRYGSWTQHTPFDRAARALRNISGGVQTNRANALQVEVICYSNKSVADEQPYRTWAGDLTPRDIYSIRQFLGWAVENFPGMSLRHPDRTALSYAEANAPGFRVTNGMWYSALYGVYGHQHIPEQTHWDPAALWDLLWRKTIRRNMFPIHREEIDRTEDVRHYQKKLQQLGYTDVGLDGVADQDFLDALFDFVGSPLGGSYFSGEEAAIFDRRYIRRMSKRPVVQLPPEFTATITPVE